MTKLTIEELKRKREEAQRSIYLRGGEFRGKIIVHMGTCGIAAGARGILTTFMNEIKESGIKDIMLTTSGCAGLCSREPMATVELRNAPPVKYVDLTPERTRKIFSEHIVQGKIITDYALSIGSETDIPFFKKQMLIVLRNMGLIDPEKIDEYIARDGYSALEMVLTRMTPEKVIEEIVKSGLRGRGGAGFPTGNKWQLCRDAKKNPKFIIGNCDEGDPGAYMDRSLLESDPHTVIEGMTIAAYAIGALRGYIYIRTEYPLAIKRIHTAISQARDYGLLGRDILGTGFDFDIEIREGSGAFVCGEETSLIHSIEGKSPEPRQRPPFPVQVGLWGCPTVINNVETLANVPVIINRGADWFAGIGTEKSKGTKIFSLVGKINNTGLIEVPMGISLREIVYEIGNGIPDNKRLKAIQTGGPSGGCIPADKIDTPIDYESLSSLGSIMGSGGMIVMDEDTCMVDVARFFIQFTNDESCGKCTSCRDGSDALLEVLTRITEGEGREGDIEFLEELGSAIKDASMCGLGTTLPNPVLSTLRYFRDEYESHIKYKRCPAVVCRGIISSPCQYLCPLKTDVPAYITLIAKGEFKKALEIIRKTNPLPVVCRRVCMAHCETKCRAKDSGGSLAIKDLKRFLSDWEISSGEMPDVKPFEKSYDEKIAIIGSGPAGLTAGYELALKGYDVTIFEKLPIPGGMLAVGVPEYRLPKKLLQMEINLIEKAGVRIKTNSPVENLDTLFNDGFKAVLIAVGAHKNRRLGIPGEDTDGVIDPITFLRKINLNEPVTSLGERVGIIGGGNTAIDAARTALRLGSKDVRIFYRRTRMEMPAVESEVKSAIEEGIKIEFLVAPTRIISENGKLKGIEFIRTTLGEIDASGRRSPVPVKGSEFVVELDSLLPAISQDPEIPQGFGLDLSNWNTVLADKETFQTSKKGVFACGDAVTGPGDVTTAMATARIAAQSIHKFLRGEEVKREYEPVRPCVEIEPIKVEEGIENLSRPEMPKLPAEVRRKNFNEVELGWTKEVAMMEAKRCLRCDWELQKLLKERRKIRA